MKCPYCDEAMELGYIQCRDGGFWSKKKRAIAALPSLQRETILLAEGGGPFSGASAAAFRCGRCKIVMLDYGNPAFEWDDRPMK